MTSDNSPRKADQRSSSGFWARIFPFAIPAAIGFGAAIIFSGGMASFVQYTNTEDFCATSCHEMESTVYQEYKESVHFSSRSGVHPTCADCHVPHGNWLETIIYKTGATKELFSHFAGKVNTKEKFEAHRLEFAKNVWAEMKANDSETCRSCHKVENWDLSLHKTRARGQHEEMAETGETCIDCHKGIAHKDVQDQLEEDDSFSLDDEDDPFSLEEEEESFELE